MYNVQCIKHITSPIRYISNLTFFHVQSTLIAQLATDFLKENQDEHTWYNLHVSHIYVHTLFCSKPTVGQIEKNASPESVPWRSCVVLHCELALCFSPRYLDPEEQSFQ